MSRVLLDENIPIGLRRLLVDHEVFTVEFEGWKGLTNGRLFDAAEAAQFEIFVTADRNIRFQQRGRSLAVVVLSTTRWRDIEKASREIADTIDRVEAGAFVHLDVVRAR